MASFVILDAGSPEKILVAPGTQLGRVKIHPADVVKVDHYGQSRFHCKADNDDA